MGQVAGTLRVDVNGRLGECLRDVTDATSMVQVDVRDSYSCEVSGSNAQLGQRSEEHGHRAPAPSLNQHRGRSFDQVASRDLVPTAKERIDLNDTGGYIAGHALPS